MFLRFVFYVLHYCINQLISNYMKKISLLVLFVVLCCCNKVSDNELSVNPKREEKTGISANVESLSVDDAIVVASMFNQKSKTKASNIKDVVSIKDSIDTPLLYAVNFDEGCTLVSATKKYYPILADIEKGYIKWPTNTGVDILIQQYLDEISYVLRDNDSPVLKQEWRTYEKNGDLLAVSTRVNDDYYDLLDEFMDDMYDSGYEFNHLYKPFDDMPDDVYKKFIGHAEDSDYRGYNYMECALIGRREYSITHNVSPMLTSTWGQGEPYNLADPQKKDLGCTTIAAGQIMRYFGYPSNYNWAAMPNSITSYNSDLCNFLYDLRNAIGVNSGGGADIKDVKNALKSYGYTCTLQSHDTGTISHSVREDRPVYCRGKDVNTGVGHAWVCDGMWNYETHIVFVLYTLIFENGKPIGFEKNDASYSIDYVSTPSYHINWGQYGLYNGNFYDDRLMYTNSFDKNRNYSSNDRQELLISK